MRMKIPAGATKALAAVSKHSPEILTALGIVGTVGAVVAAVKATEPAIRTLDVYDTEAVKSGEKQEYGIDTLPLKTKVKLTWKYYIPAVLMTTASIGCMVGASATNYKRNAAITAAYTVTESALREYMAKTLEVVGPTKTDEIEAKIAQDHINNAPVQLPPNYSIPSGYGTLFYDSVFGRYFFSTIQKVDNGINLANAEMNEDGYVSVNNLFDFVAPELDPVPLGDDVGWSRKYGLINRIRRKAIAVPETSPFFQNYPSAICIEYSVEPRYRFYD